MSKRLANLAIAVAFLINVASGAEMEFFGLEHYSLGVGTIYTNENGQLGVEELEIPPTSGMGTRLGAADSGAFFFPTTEYVSDGYFAEARVYGNTLDVSNSVICTLAGRRADYGTFYVAADYSAIGADTLTYEIWEGDTLVAQSVSTNLAEIRLDAEFATPPRVNPWAQLSDGSHGTTMVFINPPLSTLPLCDLETPCARVWGHTIVIRPNNPTYYVDSVSHIEVFGGGGLPRFQYNGLAVGMFGRPHTSLDSARLIATNRTLSIRPGPPGSNAPRGVLAEFGFASVARIRLQPVAIAAANTNDIQERFETGATGIAYGYQNYLGSAWLQNSNGSLTISAAGGLGEYPQEYTLVVTSAGQEVGRQSLSNNASVAISGAPRLLGTGANADSATLGAGIYFSFDRAGSIALASGSVSGDAIFVTIAPGTPVPHVTAVSLYAQVIPSVAIVGESSDPNLPILSIARAGGTVVVSWPDPARVYQLLAAETVDGSWEPVPDLPVYENGIAYVTLDSSVPPSRFFTLRLGGS